MSQVAILHEYLWTHTAAAMRQLKGKVKETPAQKKERKKEFRENKENIMKIAVPALVIAAIVVFLIVYMAAGRPKTY
ncbi:Single-pass membrane and coiled-coil domain-containing protein 4 [Orchesella cincta]|uniref:Single-pass membrane and coiled-coil domain-containing protein 4 homolog n=1 Tax=Orchesella cincta TaxID=48709 RepID=A0A1D2MJI5_ORCCI|nr:Single-pass membrane and coiled-coil domain-containing protein 4 [Orchesella cincta]